MSGFEVSGLVLGAIPLLVEALQFYKSRAKDIFRHEEVMNELIRKLHAEHVLFRSTCTRLIDGLVADDKMEDLLDSATEAAWAKALADGLEDKLKDRLSSAYHFCTSTIRNIGKNLVALEAVIGLVGPNKQSWRDTTHYSTPVWHRETWRKIKDCLNHDKHAALLGGINEDNIYLERFIQSSTNTAPVVFSRRKKSHAKYLESVRQSAKSLYSALLAGWCCNCHYHGAYMQLQNTTEPNENDLRFNMVLSYSKSAATSMTLTWKEIEVESRCEDNSTSVQGAQVSFTLNTNPSRPSDTRIADLCQSLQGSSTSDCVGFIDEQNRKHYIHTTLPSSPASQMQGPVTLFDVLSKGGSLSAPINLDIDLLDRYHLAVILASSILQLNSTSWLDHRWGCNDVYFVTPKTAVMPGDCAYITKAFCPNSSVQNPQGTAAVGAALRHIAVRSETIFALGKTLVELSLSAPLESQKLPADEGIVELVDCVIARRLQSHPRMKRRNVKEWNEVVERCLQCQFSSPPDLETDAFRQEFYQAVVAPLQKLYDDAR